MSNLPREFYYDPTIKDNHGWTVAMIAARYGKIKDLPREFYHDATLKNDRDMTVAMHAAWSGYI